MKTIEHPVHGITFGFLVSLATVTAAQTLSPDDVQRAQAPIVGKVMFTRGDVRIVDADGNSRPARQGEFIQPGERVITGSGALGQVKMVDGSRVGIRAGSELGFKKPAGAVAGAPNVLELLGGDVRVLNRKFDKQSHPTEYILQTPGGIVQLNHADSLATLRPGATKQTRVRISAGDAVISNKSGKSETITVNQMASITASEVTKEASTGLATAVPSAASRAKTVENNEGQTVALASPLDGLPGGNTVKLKPLRPLARLGGTGATGFVGYDVPDKTITIAPYSKRTEEKLTPNLMANQQLKPSVPSLALSNEPLPIFVLGDKVPIGKSPASFAAEAFEAIKTGSIAPLSPTGTLTPKLSTTLTPKVSPTVSPTFTPTLSPTLDPSLFFTVTK